MTEDLYNRLPLSRLEERFMGFIWSSGSVTAADVRIHFAGRRRPMKDSTVRTILRRLEAKQYLTHTAERRSHRYSAVVSRPEAAAVAVRRVADRLCFGSLERLLSAMVELSVIDRKALEETARQIAKSPRPDTESA